MRRLAGCVLRVQRVRVAGLLRAPLAGAGLDEVLDVVDVAAREGDDAVARAHVQVAALEAPPLHAQRREALVGAHLRARACQGGFLTVVGRSARAHLPCLSDISRLVSPLQHQKSATTPAENQQQVPAQHSDFSAVGAHATAWQKVLGLQR